MTPPRSKPFEAAVSPRHRAADALYEVEKEMSYPRCLRIVDLILAAALPPDPAPETRRSAIIAGCMAIREPETVHCGYPNCICDVPEIVDAALRDFRASLLLVEEPS